MKYYLFWSSPSDDIQNAMEEFDETEALEERCTDLMAESKRSRWDDCSLLVIYGQKVEMEPRQVATVYKVKK